MKIGLGAGVAIAIVAFWVLLGVLGFFVIPASGAPCNLDDEPRVERAASFPDRNDEAGIQSVQPHVIGADAVVKAEVKASEQHYEAQGDRRFQDVCLGVREIWKGDGLSRGDKVLVRWHGDPTGEGSDRPPPPTMLPGEEYVVFLTETSATSQAAPEIDFYVGTGGVYMLDQLSDSEAVALEEAVGAAPDPGARLSELLRENGIPAGNMYVHEARLQRVPPVRGSVMDLSTGGGAVLFDAQRIHDAAAAQGFDLSPWTDKNLQFLVMPIGEESSTDTTVQALATGNDLVGAWIRTAHDYWSLSDWPTVKEVVADEARDVFRPPRNRAGASVNLSEWFGAETVISIEASSLTTSVPRDVFSTPESIQSVIGALNREFPTQLLPPDGTELRRQCGDISVHFERSDGYTYYTVYRALDNRLYASEDGFSVEAPPELAAALGISAGSPPAC